MTSVVQIRVRTVFVMMLALTINLSSSYAGEEIDNNKLLQLSILSPSSLSDPLEEDSALESPPSPRRYQLLRSEGRESFKWAIENQLENKKVKLKYIHSPLPSKMDFGSELPFIHTQGYLGSCTAQTLTLSLEYCFKKLGKTLSFSPLFVYYNERLLNDTVEEDCGASLSDGLQAVCKYGACQENTWTYVDDGIKFKKKPSEEAYMESGLLFQGYTLHYQQLTTDIELIKHSLAKKIPVVCGINIFPSFEYENVERTGKVTMPKHKEKPIGAHALTLVGYNDETEQFKFANSWGPHWGDKGFGYLPYDYVANNNLTNRWVHTHSNELWGIDLTSSV